MQWRPILRGFRNNPAVGRALLILGSLALWQLAVRGGSAMIFPPPSAVLVSMVKLLGLPEIRRALLEAFGSVLIAFGLAAMAGILAGLVMGLSQIFYAAAYPIFVLLNSIPKMIFMPLVVLTLGIEAPAKITYGFFSAVLPVAISVTTAVRSVDEKLIRAARSMAASKFRMVWNVIIPGTAPAIFSSLWYGLQYALLGVLLMELFVSTRGVGYFISEYALQPDRVFALMLLLALGAMSLTAAWRAVERKTTRWRGAGLQ
jgi:ABC-type nitrate/sulfonate/bicarbonate transport system permease component